MFGVIATDRWCGWRISLSNRAVMDDASSTWPADAATCTLWTPNGCNIPTVVCDVTSSHHGPRRAGTRPGGTCTSPLAFPLPTAPAATSTSRCRLLKSTCAPWYRYVIPHPNTSSPVIPLPTTSLHATPHPTTVSFLLALHSTLSPAVLRHQAICDKRYATCDVRYAICDMRFRWLTIMSCWRNYWSGGLLCDADDGALAAVGRAARQPPAERSNDPV
jgi:hypothetical protein